MASNSKRHTLAEPINSMKRPDFQRMNVPYWQTIAAADMTGVTTYPLAT
jgi:hypothetical protein